jgi:hypothetical protein
MHDLLYEFDKLPLLEGRHADLAVDVDGTHGKVMITGFVIDRDGRVLITLDESLRLHRS